MPRKRAPSSRRRVCFVTGTRAEFGLMQTTLEAIRSHPRLSLQIIVTGMHLDASRGSSRRQIEQEGWTINRVVSWKRSTDSLAMAQAAGGAVAGLGKAFRDLKTDVVLIVGDRVEAFAAASAAHIGGLIVAHVHGGDRALGQIDDSLRHAITKLSHIHFPATESSARRIARLGEDRDRIRLVGSPGNDGITKLAAKRMKLRPFIAGLGVKNYALLVLHPVSADETIERRRAELVLRAIRKSRLPAIAVYPNNDPGSSGIIDAWNRHESEFAAIHKNVSREIFLGLVRDAAVLVGNSSSGIIEAGSLGTPVVDVGPRQKGRERGRNVVNVPYSEVAIVQAIESAHKNHRPARLHRSSVYSGDGAGRKIASVLADLHITQSLLRKLITY